MNKDDIKKVIGKLAPDEEMELRISEKVLQKQHYMFSLKPIASIAAILVIVFSLGILLHYFSEKKTGISHIATDSTDGSNMTNGTTATMDMIGLIVYQGREYTQTSTRISPEAAGKLLGEKLGTTKGNLNEGSKQRDYTVEFASSIGKKDVYSVKGYDKSFRIMTYEKINGIVNAEFFECFDGLTIKSGADVFGKLKLENNIKSAKQEKFESWNLNKQQYTKLKNLQTLNSFVKELKNTIPYTQQSMSYIFDEQGDAKQKFVYIMLNDGCEVQLMLFKDGYIFYDGHTFFKMNNEIFNKLWNELE